MPNTGVFLPPPRHSGGVRGPTFPGMGGMGYGNSVPIYGNNAPASPGGVVGPSGPNLNVNAQTSPELQALLDRNNRNLDEIESGTGHEMDVMGQKFRDAREGGRESLRQANAFAGRASTPATAGYEAETQKGVQGTLADVALRRRQMLTGAIQGSLGIARAPGDMALAEKGLGLQAYQAQTAAQNAAAQLQLQQMLALLNAQRQSPIYSGF